MHQYFCSHIKKRPKRIIFITSETNIIIDKHMCTFINIWNNWKDTMKISISINCRPQDVGIVFPFIINLLNEFHILIIVII